MKIIENKLKLNCFYLNLFKLLALVNIPKHSGFKGSHKSESQQINHNNELHLNKKTDLVLS